MDNFKMVSPCLLGVEGLVADELRRMGAADVSADNGRVFFSGNADVLSRANLWLRTAERVLIVLGEFEATTFDMLFEAVKKINFQDYIGKNDAFPVSGYSLNSKLFSIPDCQKIIKKSIVEKLKAHYKLSWFEETGAEYKIKFSIIKDRVTIMLDTSGDGLYKRGYRKQGNLAPIKETLAAAIVNIARTRDRTQLYDPFCGSGTLLIEGAMTALNIAPGLKRRFAAEKYSFLPESAFKNERQRAIDLIYKDAAFRAYGSDIDINAVELAKNNAKIAGIDKYLSVERADIKDFNFKTERGTVVTNPPYGERMATAKEAAELYKIMGEVMPAEQYKSYHIITSDEMFEDCFMRKADKKRKLYNGMIKCNLYIYFK